MEVLLVEALGHSCLVTLRHGDWQAIALCFGAAGGGSTLQQLEQGPMVEVSFNFEHAHLFDRCTGLALNESRPAG